MEGRLAALAAQAVRAEAVASALTSRVRQLLAVAEQRDVARLKVENESLKEQVARAKAALRAAEIANGKPQVPLPGAGGAAPAAAATAPAAKAPEKQKEAKGKEQPVQQPQEGKKEAKTEKKKKGGDNKQPKEKAAAAAAAPLDVSRLNLRVGLIKKAVPHGDKLYLEEVDVGEDKPRTILSGLQEHVAEADMQNRPVVVLLNLKPRKLAGIESQGMVMCASRDGKVEILAPPAGAQPGDVVRAEGYEGEPDAQLNPKKKIFEAVAPDLHTNGSKQACYKDAILQVAGKGPCTAPTLTDAAVK